MNKVIRSVLTFSVRFIEAAVWLTHIHTGTNTPYTYPCTHNFSSKSGARFLSLIIPRALNALSCVCVQVSPHFFFTDSLWIHHTKSSFSRVLDWICELATIWHHSTFLHIRLLVCGCVQVRGHATLSLSRVCVCVCARAREWVNACACACAHLLFYVVIVLSYNCNLFNHFFLCIYVLHWIIIRLIDFFSSSFTRYIDGMFQSKFTFMDNKVLS